MKRTTENWRGKARNIAFGLVLASLLLISPGIAGINVVPSSIPTTNINPTQDVLTHVFHYNNGTIEHVQNVFVTVVDTDIAEEYSGYTDITGRFNITDWTNVSDGHLIISNCTYLMKEYSNSTISPTFTGPATITAIDINVTDVTPPSSPVVNTPSALFSILPYQVYVNGTSEPMANVTLEAEGFAVDNTTAAVDGSYSFLVTLTNNTNITVRADDVFGNAGSSGQWMTMLPVGAGGGMVFSGDGNISLDIPPGAMAGESIITISSDSTENPHNNSLPVYEFGPDGTTFSSPATMTLQYNTSNFPERLEDRLKVLYKNDSSVWTEIYSSLDLLMNTVTADVWHFTSFTIGPALAETYQAGPNWTDIGAQIPILRVNISDNGGGGDTFDSLNITSNNTDDSRVDGVSLWLDDGDQMFHPDLDTLQIGTTPFTAGRINFTSLGIPLALNGFIDLFVVYNVSDTAQDGDRLDCWINAGDLWLQSQGNTTLLMDPAGNTSVNGTSPPIPYAIYGYTFNTIGVVTGSITVNITNNNTGESVVILSNSSGMYEYDLTYLPSSYSEGDVIWTFANDTTPNYGGNETTVIESYGSWLNLSLELGPVASNPDPQDDWVVTDEYKMVNLTLDDISGTYDVDPTTIVININGTNYTVDGTNLTYTGTLLSFDTTAAGEKWEESTWVNVTLWAANDTIGNPCQNAPYSYRFMYSSSLLNAPDIRVHKDGNDLNITWTKVDNAVWYHVFISNETDGTGFNFSSIVSSRNRSVEYFVHVGANANTSNYSYVVRALNYAGISGKSNIGWKLIKELKNNALTSDINWLALPYNSDLLYAQDLINDLGGAANINYISRWSVAVQSYQNKNPTGGFNWPITPGEGLLLNMKTTINYTIVGSYNASTTVNITENALTSDINWIALPYHTDFGTAQDLINDLGGAANINYISRWSVAVQSYQNKNPTGGFNWPTTPGEPILVNAKNTIPNYNLGSTNDP